jgi:hypothetical protein
MINETPYIVVDNRKIAPIERSPRPDAATADRPRHQEQPFGVVDRVTISREAQERSRHDQARGEADLPAIESPAKQQLATGPLLTYSPKQLR